MEQAAQGSRHSTKLLELRKYWDITLRHTVWVVAVWSQGLHSVILVSPFQCKIFYDSMKQGRKWERYWRV